MKHVTRHPRWLNNLINLREESLDLHTHVSAFPGDFNQTAENEASQIEFLFKAEIKIENHRRLSNILMNYI